MDEFDLIRTYFAPLADAPGSLGLTDDAALITPPPGHEIVVTVDAISEGIHFLGSESPDLIARKLLRVNLSDLAAMGASPLAYFLTLMLPSSVQEDWVKQFAAGLGADQKQFGIHLAGGDTTATRNDKSFSVTALGTVTAGQALRRNGAKAGDLIYVSGTLGDGALGLLSLQKNLGRKSLEQRYLLPEPRLSLGRQLRGIASACIDISDGLVQDLGHICAAARVAADVERNRLPLSEEARAMVTKDPKLWNAVLGGGDDYELLFTVSPDKAASMPQGCTQIGVIKSGSGVRVLDDSGKPLSLTRAGFRHFT